MKALNTDDIFLRNLTIALLDLLNGSMTLSLSRDDHKETFSVPFLYNFGTDEGFLKDFYIGLPDNCQIPVAEGTYDIIPRGIVTLSSFQVLYSLPMSVKFDVKIICDNLNKAFKIAEKMLDINYANRVMYFQYNGVRIPAQFQFPTNETVDKVYKFTMTDQNKINVTLSIDVETYFPSFEQSSKRLSTNVIERINLNKKDDSGNNMTSGWVDQNTPII